MPDVVLQNRFTTLVLDRCGTSNMMYHVGPRSMAELTTSVLDRRGRHLTYHVRHLHVGLENQFCSSVCLHSSVLKKKIRWDTWIRYHTYVLCGSVTYSIVCTKPNLARATSILSCFMANLGKENWPTMKWLLRYIGGTIWSMVMEFTLKGL